MTADTPEGTEPGLPAERFVDLLQLARRANVPAQYVSDVRLP